VLALSLGGRTIAEWQAAMTQPEFEAWIEFYRRWPFHEMPQDAQGDALSRAFGIPVR
jgi:hypothetical protein